jgi:serine/threonine protein kinase
MNPTLSSVDPSQSLELDVLLQEYVRSWRAGEAPDIEDYARMHLEHADDIRELLPTVIFAEQLNPGAASSTQDLPQKHPVQLGAFTLGREIGRGGMGIVYEATQLQLSQKFAIKVLKNGVIASKLLHSRFACEAEAASRLHHPHIVPAKYYGFDANCSYLVMPKIDGISIDRLIAKIETNDPEIQARYDQICQDWGKIAELGAQLASALSHAHSHGMVHRDIKPANLILDRSGNSWVTDFGLAKVFADEGGLSRTGEVIGTPRYMAPEQVMGVTDARSDIYALGLTLYEILAGQHPQKPVSKEPTSKESKDCRTSVLEIPDLRTINPNVPESLASAIMKACSHYPEARYQSAREFEYTLNALRFDGNSDRRSFSRDILNTRQDQRRRTAVLSGILLVSFLSLFFYRESTEINDRVNDITICKSLSVGRIRTSLHQLQHL